MKLKPTGTCLKQEVPQKRLACFVSALAVQLEEQQEKAKAKQRKAQGALLRTLY